jgi:hypothetical protein
MSGRYHFPHVWPMPLPPMAFVHVCGTPFTCSHTPGRCAPPGAKPVPALVPCCFLWFRGAIRRVFSKGKPKQKKRRTWVGGCPLCALCISKRPKSSSPKKVAPNPNQPGQNPKYWPLQALIGRIWPRGFLCCCLSTNLKHLSFKQTIC